MAPLRLLLASLLAVAVLAAPGAGAMYVVTPLKIQVSDDTPNVGDSVTLTLLPDPEYNDPNATSLAGRTIVVKYNFDPKEGEENSEPGSAQATFREIAAVTLDAEQRATITWTVPQELDDHNAFLTAVDENGEDVGVGYGPVAVGDAPPVMAIMRSTGAEGGGEPLANDGQPDSTGMVDETPQEESGEENAVPGMGLVAFVAVAGLAALALRRRG